MSEKGHNYNVYSIKLDIMYTCMMHSHPKVATNVKITRVATFKNLQEVTKRNVNLSQCPHSCSTISLAFPGGISSIRSGRH